MADVEVKGLKELERNLVNLGAKVAKKVARQAIRAGAQEIQLEAQLRAPEITGQLARSIGVEVTAGTESGRITEHIGPISVTADFGGDTSKGSATAQVGPQRNKGGGYGHLVEFGTAPHVIRAEEGGALALHGGKFATEVQHPGSKPRPFMRPAFEGKKEKAVDVIGKELWKGIEREAK